MKFEAATLAALKRSEIQRLAKENGVKANQKTSDIIDELLLLGESSETADIGSKQQTTDGEIQQATVTSDLSWPSPLVHKRQDTATDEAHEIGDDAPSDPAPATDGCGLGKTSSDVVAAKATSSTSAVESTETFSIALPEITVRFCVVDGLKVASSHWHKLVLRAGTLHVKSTRSELPDCRFVLKTAEAVENAPDEHERDNLVCDACATQNHTQANAPVKGESIEQPAVPVTERATVPPHTPTVVKRPYEAVTFDEHSPAVARPPVGVAPRSTVKKSALMTPAERQQDRIMKARLQQSEKREKLFMARRNLAIDAAEDTTESDRLSSRPLPVASLLHKKKLPMTASLDPARLLASPSTQQGQ